MQESIAVTAVPIPATAPDIPAIIMVRIPLPFDAAQHPVVLSNLRHRALATRTAGHLRQMQLAQPPGTQENSAALAEAFRLRQLLQLLGTTTQVLPALLQAHALAAAQRAAKTAATTASKLSISLLVPHLSARRFRLLVHGADTTTVRTTHHTLTPVLPLTERVLLIPQRILAAIVAILTVVPVAAPPTAIPVPPLTERVLLTLQRIPVANAVILIAPPEAPALTVTPAR